MSKNRHTKDDLRQLQALPLELKVRMTEQRIREWVRAWGEDGVYISFSGGLDSTVLLHLARNLYPDMKAVFFNTSLEFPELVKFVKTFDNVDIVKPEKTFVETIKKYGYPMISKEVAECVNGARKYLTALAEQNSLNQSINQSINRRSGTIRSIVSYADLVSTISVTGGGYENKYRKLRGIGNYAKHDSVGKSPNVVAEYSTGDDRQSSRSAFVGNQSNGRQSNNGDYP